MLQALNTKTTVIFEKFHKKIEEKKQLRNDEIKKINYLAFLSDAKKDVDIKRNRFNNATDENLSECLIYELKAAEAKLNYCINLAKADNLINNDYIEAQFSKHSEKEW